MNKTWNLIKKIFIRKKDNEQEVINEEKNSINITNINLDLINSIANNDIVLVKMNEEEIIKRNIELSHQKRPFLIKKKKDNEQSVLGYYLTSNIHYSFFEKEKYKGLKLVLSKETYTLKKNSIIKLNKIVKLPYENIISILGHINNKDLNKLKKYRDLLCGNPVISNKENKLIETCDIILDNEKKYIIYQTDNTNSYGYPISETSEIINIKTNHNYIEFNKKLYLIDYKNSKVFNNNSKLCIIERWNQDIVDTINSNKKLLKYELKNKSKIKKK